MLLRSREQDLSSLWTTEPSESWRLSVSSVSLALFSLSYAHSAQRNTLLSSSACSWPKYFFYTLKYQPFTFSTKLSEFPRGLRLFHDKCQKDMQAISEFSPLAASPEAIKYRVKYGGAERGRGDGNTSRKKDWYLKMLFHLTWIWNFNGFTFMAVSFTGRWKYLIWHY